MRIGDNEMALSFLQPVLQAAHRKGLGRHEAVAVREIAAFNVAVAEGDDEAIVEGDDPVDGPGKADIQVLRASTS
jgi:hypothetical protein